MDRAAALRKLAAAGVLVSPEVAAAASPEQLAALAERAAGPAQSKAAAEQSQQLAAFPTGGTAARLEQPATIADQSEAHAQALQQRLTVADVAAAYQRKFEQLRDILLRRVPAVSLRMAQASSGSVSCIGMVRSAQPSGFVLEDLSGQLEVVRSSGSIEVEPDDVVGVSGAVREGRLYANELLLPDVPLPKARLPAPIQLALPAASPQWLGRVLAWRPPQPVSPSQGILILRKRWLPILPIPRPAEPALIEPVPEVLWFVCEPAWAASYKGVALIASAKPLDIMA